MGTPWPSPFLVMTWPEFDLILKRKLREELEEHLEKIQGRDIGYLNTSREVLITTFWFDMTYQTIHLTPDTYDMSGFFKKFQQSRRGKTVKAYFTAPKNDQRLGAMINLLGMSFEDFQRMIEAE